jgi:hypothetical protein
MNMYDLPDSYRFTEQDVDAYMQLFKKEFVDNQTLTPEEEEFYHVVDEADRLRWIIKRLPTMGELKQYWKEQEDAKKKS